MISKMYSMMLAELLLVFSRKHRVVVCVRRTFQVPKTAVAVLLQQQLLLEGPSCQAGKHLCWCW
jgi:hypothetical protein